MVFICFLVCAKKEKEKERAAVQPENVAVHVEVPKVSWKKTIAVLPVVNTEDSVRTETIAAVLTEQLALTLSRTHELKILAPSSRDWLEKSGMEPDYILNTNLDQKNNTVTLSLKLVDVKKDSSVWEDEETVEDIFSVSEQVSGSVSEWFAYASGDSSAPKRVSSEIMALYLDGKSHLAGNTREETDLAVQKFKEALRMDSTFALASVALAESYLQIHRSGWDHNPVWLRLAQQASLNAVTLDPDLAEAQLQLGQVYLDWGDVRHAEEGFRKALQLNSNLSEAWQGLGTIFLQYGFYAPCMEVYDRALALEPGAVSVSLSRAMILNGWKRFEEAERELRTVLQLHPDQKYIHTFLALTQYYLGDYKKAEKEIGSGMESEEYLPLAHAVLGMIHARTGRLDEALTEVELEVKPQIHNNASLATAAAAIYSLLGQNGQAMSFLEKAASWGYKEYLWLANDPNFDNLREDERFVQFLEGMKTDWEANMQRYALTEKSSDKNE
jgi:tetratricopeptide (TPR) repeat protein/TolB-like protein